MNILNGFNFMMPTQAADAIVLDGSIIIVIGFIALAYLLYKHRNELLAVDENSHINSVDNENINTQIGSISNQDYNTADNIQSVNDKEKSIQKSNVNNDEAIEEEYYDKNEKEIVLNYR